MKGLSISPKPKDRLGTKPHEPKITLLVHFNIDSPSSMTTEPQELMAKPPSSPKLEKKCKVHSTKISLNEKKITATYCPMCKRQKPHYLIKHCPECGRIGCSSCLGVRTYVDLGNEWVAFGNLKRRKNRP